jgi:hypothetical protein
VNVDYLGLLWKRNGAVRIRPEWARKFHSGNIMVNKKRAASGMLTALWIIDIPKLERQLLLFFTRVDDDASATERSRRIGGVTPTTNQVIVDN